MQIRYSLPTSVSFNDESHEIRTDFRVILDIVAMLEDPELSGADKTEALMEMFYLHPQEIKDWKKAVEAAFDFIDGGSKRPKKKKPRLTDWQQDFEFIIAPVNRVLGYEARAVEYDPTTNKGGVHWWTFLAAFMEIGGDCLYSQILTIRDKQARKAKLEKHEQAWLRRNGDLVRIAPRYTEQDEELFRQWT